MSKNLYLAAYIVIFLVALAFRVYHIDYRPFHHDEGVNHYFLLRMSDLGYYPYSHINYHGPLYFYLLYFVTKIFGYSELAMRSVAIISGVSVIPLLYLFRNIIGQNVSLIASALLSVSATQIFISRYNIHESTLIFAQLLLLLSIYAWSKKFEIKYIYLSFLALALMIATKETFVIFTAGVGFAGLFTMTSKDLLTKIKEQQKHFMYASLLTGLLVIFIFSAGFTWVDGVKEMFMAVPQWVGRGSSDTGHFKSWGYYLCIILGSSVLDGPFSRICNGSLNYTPEIGSEIYLTAIPFLLLGYVYLKFKDHFYSYLGIVVISLLMLSASNLIDIKSRVFLSDPRVGFNILVFGNLVFFAVMIFNSSKKIVLNFIGFTAISTVLIAYVYSYVGYKTPWLIVNITIGLILLFSALFNELLQNEKFKSIGLILLPACLVLSSYCAVTFNFGVEDSKNNPLYYVHTRSGMLKFVDDLQHYVSSRHKNRILIGIGSYWPLPYYLRKMNLQYDYNKKSDLNADSGKYDIILANFDSTYKSDEFTSKYYRFSDNQEVMVYFRKN